MRNLLVKSLVSRLDKRLSGAASAIQRYFTSLDGIMQSYTLTSAVAADRIVMNVMSPTGITAGLPTGAPAPTAGKLTTIDFAYTGSIQDVGKNGASFFDGYIANVKIYNVGVLLVDAKLDEDFATTTIAVNSANPSNNLTTNNITSSDLFTEDTTYGWLGEDLFNPLDTVQTPWIDNGGGSYTVTGVQVSDRKLATVVSFPKVGVQFKYSVNIESLSGGAIRMFAGSGAGTSSFDYTAAGIKVGALDGADNSNEVRIIARSGALGTVSDIAFQRILEVAP